AYSISVYNQVSEFLIMCVYPHYKTQFELCRTVLNLAVYLKIKIVTKISLLLNKLVVYARKFVPNSLTIYHLASELDSLD
ncbi:hypothetical protein L9F63_001717, partial [Diploptera punctata]